MNRTDFVKSMAAGAAASAFLRKTALASAPSASGSGPILNALIATMLPIGTSGFPDISSDALVARMDGIYKLNADAVFTASLRAFNQMDAFAVSSPQTIEIERATAPHENVNKSGTIDAAAFAASGLRAYQTFVDAEPSARIAYVALWQHSAFNVRRRFYQSVRALSLSTLYSMPESWSAIGYRGPLLSQAR